MSAIRRKTEMLSSQDLYHFDLAIACCPMKCSSAVRHLDVRATVKKDLGSQTLIARKDELCRRTFTASTLPFPDA